MGGQRRTGYLNCRMTSSGMTGIAAIMRDVTARFEELRALRKELGTLDLFGLALENVDELMPDDLSLALGIDDVL